MATKKRNVKRTATLSKAPTKTATKRRRTAVSSRQTKSSGNIFNFLIPLVFILAILAGLGFLLFKGYQTVTASSFFDVKKIDVRGTVRIPKDEIEKIVRQRTERDGVWNAQLEQIKADVEKMNFVKSVVVSRILPDGIQVRVEERNARAVVRLDNGDFWVDDDATIVSAVAKSDKNYTILTGWDKSETEKARKNNQERVKIYLKIQNDLQKWEITRRINAFNLSDLQDAQAIIEDSGASVPINLGKEDFGRRLKNALPYVEGKGAEIEYLKSYGGQVAVVPRNG